MRNKYKEALDNLVYCKSITRCKECKHKNLCTMERDSKILQELVDKEEPKEPILDSGVTYCPRCRWVVDLTFVHNNHNRGLVVRPDKYCHNCGQRLREEK